MAAYGKRTKSGCITCRIRRVKCDEVHPACNRCTSTGRKCDGYSTLPFSRRDLHAASQAASPNRKSPSPETGYDISPISRLVTDPAFSDVLEKRYFQFFRHRTILSTNSLLDSRFWDRTVLQASHSVPAIKHAILALASWHQSSDSPSSDLQHRRYADRQYQLALQKARTLVSAANPEDLDKVLIACIVFICFEGVRGDYKASQLHMDNGRAIVRQHSTRFRQTSRRNDLVEIQQALARLDLPVVTFSDTQAPYHYSLKDFLDTDPMLIPWKFKDICEARSSLVDLSRWVLVINHYVDRAFYEGDMDLYLSLEAEKEKCQSRIRLWKEYFDEIASSDVSPSPELLALNLRQWYHGVQAIILTPSIGPETRWDDVMEHFIRVVDMGEEIVRRLTTTEDPKSLSFSYDIGYIITVFLAATRCRDPFLRRRAIRILRAIPRQEGVWNSIPAAAIAERWIELEEAGLGIIATADDVPEQRRVKVIDTAVDVEGGSAEICFTFFAGEGNETAWYTKEIVSWVDETDARKNVG